MPEPIETLEDALKVITELRTENGATRKRAKDAEDKVTELGLQVDGLSTQVEEHSTTIAAKDSELGTERFERTRDRLALERGIPLDLASKINAADEASLTTSLDALAAFRGAPGETPAAIPQPDPAQAATPVNDPKAEALANAEAFFTQP